MLMLSLSGVFVVWRCLWEFLGSYLWCVILRCKRCCGMR